ncbi:MAG: ABC transporter permease, partial [Opitutaceae bacterium]|nr:ABC transporter permease [Opitutaceae bacterium]
MIVFFFSLRDAIRSLWAYRLRSLLTGLGVAIGVATVIAILAIIEGLNVSFREQIAGMGTGTLYVTRTPWIVLADWWRVSRRPQIVRKEAQYLEEKLLLPKAVVPFMDTRGTITAGRSSLQNIRVIGSTELWTLMTGIEPIEGRFLARGDVQAGRELAVAGADIAEVMRLEGL